MDTIIKIIPQRDYIAFLSRPSEGRMAATHLATVRWHDGSIGRFYVKMYMDDSPRGLVNEITGYLMAHGDGIDQPSKAGLIQIPLEIVRSMGFNVADGVQFVWGWASEECGKTPTTILNMNDVLQRELCKNMLRNWPHVHQVAAFDDWIANQDRNAGNVVVIAKNKFAVIDHGNAPVSSTWKANDLNPSATFKNLLMGLWDDNPSLPIKYEIVKSAKNHSQSLTKVQAELLYWWNQLLPDDCKKAIESFIAERAANSSVRLTQNLGMLVA